MKKRQALLYVSIIAFLLSACQDSPKKSVVTSRNDGSFDTNVVQSAEESHAPDATESLTVFDTFDFCKYRWLCYIPSRSAEFN